MPGLQCRLWHHFQWAVCCIARVRRLGCACAPCLVQRHCIGPCPAFLVQGAVGLSSSNPLSHGASLRQASEPPCHIPRAGRRSLSAHAPLQRLRSTGSVLSPGPWWWAGLVLAQWHPGPVGMALHGPMAPSAHGVLPPRANPVVCPSYINQDIGGDGRFSPPFLWL